MSATTGDVRGYYASIGIELPGWSNGNAPVACFSDSEAHRNGDRTPSCSVSTENGAWACHGCGAKGGAYDAALARGRSPADAMELLRSHGLVDDNGHTEHPVRTRKASPPKPCVTTEEDVARFSRDLVTSDATLARVRDLLGVSVETIKALDVGIGPCPGGAAKGELRVVFPRRGANGELAGVVFFQPNRERRDATRKKSWADGSRGLWFAPVEGEEVIWIVEGEPAAAAAHAVGLSAVGIPGTQGWRSEYAEGFGGRRVVVVPDCDRQGRELAARVAADLAGVAAEVRILDLEPQREDGHDVRDEVVKGLREHGEAAYAGLRTLLVAAAEHAPVIEPKPESSVKDRSGAMWSRLDVGHLLATEPQPVDWLIDGVAARSYLTLLAGREKEGKSLLSLGFSASVASGGGSVAGVDCRAGRVLVVDSENGERTMHSRLRLLGLGAEHADQLACYVVTRFDLRRSLDGLRERIKDTRADLVILDSFRSLWGGEENDSGETAAVLDPLRNLVRELNVAAILIHHMRKDGGYRGSSAVGASVEHLVELGRQRDDTEKTRRVLRCVGCRFDEEPEDRWLRIDVDKRLGCLFLDAADAPESADDEEFTPRAPVRAKLADQVKALDWENDRRWTLAGIGEAVGRSAKDGSLRNCMKALVASDGFVRHADKSFSWPRSAECKVQSPLRDVAPLHFALPDKHGDSELAERLEAKYGGGLA